MVSFFTQRRKDAERFDYCYLMTQQSRLKYLCDSAPLHELSKFNSVRSNKSIYAVTTLSRCESWGICATIALPISREEVAAGEGALQTWMEF